MAEYKTQSGLKIKCPICGEDEFFERDDYTLRCLECSFILTFIDYYDVKDEEDDNV